MHPFHAALMERQTQAQSGAAASVEEAAAPASAPRDERRQSLQQQGVEMHSTLQEDVDGFEFVVRRRSTNTSPKRATGSGSFAASVPTEPPSYRTTEKPNIVQNWEVTPESYLQAKTLALKRMKNARPSTPFSGGRSTVYAMMMARFDAASDTEAVTAGEKLLELVHWFDGPAKRIIMAQTARFDKGIAYRTARFQMDKLFKANINTLQTIITDLAKGKQIGEEDVQGHVEIYADLCEAKSVIDETMKTRTYDEGDVVRRVLEARLTHLANRFWRKNDEQLLLTGTQLGLDDLINEVTSWVSILSNRGITAKPAMTSKIAATTATSGTPLPAASYAQRLSTSPPKQQPTCVCGICGSIHETQCGNVLINANVEERVQRLQAKGLCFHCFQSGHTAKNCTQRPKCGIPNCNKTHATLLHDRKMTRSTPNPNALPFRPFQPQAPATTQDSASTSGPAAAGASSNAAVNPII